MLALARFRHLIDAVLFARHSSSPTSSSAARDEGDLVARARQMDPEAWDVIFNRYYPQIYAYLRYRVPSPEDAEDLAATVFERAVRHIRSYRELGHGLGAWLQRIASNLVVDYHRRRKVPVRRAELLPLHLQDQSPSPLEHALQVDQVQRALAHLNDPQREVLILRFLLGYSVAETAQIMGRSVEGVKSLQHRALQRLRDLWREEPPRGHRS